MASSVLVNEAGNNKVKGEGNKFHLTESNSGFSPSEDRGQGPSRIIEFDEENTYSTSSLSGVMSCSHLIIATAVAKTRAMFMEA